MNCKNEKHQSEDVIVCCRNPQVKTKLKSWRIYLYAVSVPDTLCAEVILSDVAVMIQQSWAALATTATTT